MISKKIQQLIAGALVMGVVLGTAPIKVYAAEGNRSIGIEHKSGYKDGIYHVKNKTEYIDPSNETGNSMARNALKENTNVKIENGKYRITFSFNDMLYQFMKDIKIFSGDKELEAKINDEKKSATFESDSINEKLRVDMFITMMNRKVSFYVTQDIGTMELENEAPTIEASDISITIGDSLNLLDKVKASDKEDGEVNVEIVSDTSKFLKGNVAIKAGTYDVEYKAVDKTGLETRKKVSVTVKDIVKDNLEQGKYSIKNTVEYIGDGNAQIGNEMARRTLEEVSFLQIKDDEKVLTLKFNKDQFKFIGDVNITVDGKEVEVDLNREKAEAVIKVPSINSDIRVSVAVSIMGRTTTFKTSLLENTLTKIDDTSTSKPEEETTNPGTTETKPSVDENKTEIKVVKGKLYSITNEVHYQDKNSIGQSMARQYLDKLSYIEEVEGKRYLNLTFSGIEYMSKHRFFINNQEISYKKVSDDGKKATFRFEIPNLDARIKVKMYVAPMGRDVEFDVTLNKDTLKFIKEYSVKTLPQTGGMVDSSLLFMLGSTLIGSGAYLRKKK